jgi:GNAT superfamily N-acetyltransferase
MIQLLTPSDREALAELYQELTGKMTERLKMQASLSWIIANPDYYLIGAKNGGGELLGSLMGIICHDLVGGCRPFMVLENVIVTEKHRGQGIGTQLLKWIEDVALKHNCYYIEFVSSMERKSAHQFYASLGYRLGIVQGFKKYLS